ncbi:hypothetical protein ESZ53_05365 [Salinibacterium sp. UTAS2018]|uniref:hypothetical protein n=1 Tax=Salinibacterium sp. UTAS2018 TaxID=2508880 RepID=UPI0010095C93|nr:hypothetical protein [Salinibacterium sp. UTAS2018]QAV69911.1 hypothetical protein ESZ53_05365 [Salinibacterium sp. UTAS2018]
MQKSSSKTIIAIAAIALAGFGLTGCSAGESAGSTGSSDSGDVAAPEAAADLMGEWKQTNSQSDDAYQAATITADEITIYWVSNGGDSKSLYWAGTYEAPTEPGAFSWDSENDTSQTDSAMLASGDPSKTFTFDNDEISYEASALGTTTTVRLARE